VVREADDEIVVRHVNQVGVVGRGDHRRWVADRIAGRPLREEDAALVKVVNDLEQRL
jgi:hypothetical protein